MAELEGVSHLPAYRHAEAEIRQREYGDYSLQRKPYACLPVTEVPMTTGIVTLAPPMEHSCWNQPAKVAARACLVEAQR